MSRASQQNEPLLLAEAAWGIDYLLETYPPRWFHKNKKLIFEICKPAELDKEGEIKIKRYLETSCPEFVSLPKIDQEFGNYKYLPNLEKDKTTHWQRRGETPAFNGSGRPCDPNSFGRGAEVLRDRYRRNLWPAFQRCVGSYNPGEG